MLKRITILTLFLTSFVTFPVWADKYSYEWLSLGMSESPATIQRVRWRTSPDSPSGVAELIKATSSPDVWKETRQYKAVSRIENDYGVIKAYHHVSFNDLIPDTKYLYRIGDGDKQWSEWYEFSTAAIDPQDFSFIYISDVQVGIRDHYPRVIRKAVNTATDPSFIMFTGDMTGGASEGEWNDFFYANGWVFGMLPVVAVPDNHEYARRDGDSHKTLTTYWDHLFSYPENTPPGLLAQGNYYYDYQGCRFIMINTKELLDGSKEFRDNLLAWIEEKLATNPYPWTIIGQHQPIYSVAEGRNSDRIKALLKPLYDKYEVDLVLTGHDHVYGRMRGEQNTSGNGTLSGPVYVVSIAGSQVYMPEYYTYVDRLASNTQLFQIISVSGSAIDFKAYLATGELYDHFRISKDGNRKQFTDHATGWPEITDQPTKTWQVYTDEDRQNFQIKREEYLRSKKIPASH